MLRKVLLALLALVLTAAPALAAEAPEIVAELGAEEIFVGESVDYVVEVRNLKEPEAPDVTALREDFDVTPNGDESRNQSSTFIINGRVTQKSSFSHVYRFRLTPKRAGRLTVAAPSITVDGKTISGRALRLNVITPEPQDVVVAEITVDQTRVYPTQPFEVTLRILVKPLPDDPETNPLAPLRRRPPQIQINWVEPPPGLETGEKSRWLEGLLSKDEAGFAINDLTVRSMSLFEGPRAALFNLLKGREGRKGLDGDPANYFVYELRRQFTPARTGTYALGPAVVKGAFVEGMKGRNYTARKLVAIAPAVTVEVREVPSPRPATFCGGIGNYKVAASASPTKLRVGDPLTLTLEIERGPGSASLDLISAPDLGANPAIAADFDVVDHNPTGRTAGDVKRFAYALRPRRAGVEVPALPVTVFNPDTEHFSEIATRPIELDVSEASRLGSGELVGSLGGSATPDIKSREQGIFQNVTDPAELRDQNVNVLALAETAAGAWCAAGCLIAIVVTRRRKSGDVAGQRRQQARRRAAARLAEARTVLARGDAAEALRATRSALVGLVADMRNLVGEGLTAAEAERILAGTSVPAEDRAELSRLLETIESAEYGSGAGGEVPAMIAAAEALLPKLARQLERDRA